MDSKVEKKVVVVGKYCVGKTSLICRFTNKTFNERSPYETTTIGAAYTGKKIKLTGSKAFRLGIWDTAGSEQFESMTALYYRGTKAAIVCYDITDVSSFEKAKFYVNELRENVLDCRLYLCGTKSDLVSSGKHFRGVPQHEVTEYGQKVNARTVIETSSKTGQNVEELFWRIAKDFLEEITTGKVDYTADTFGVEPSQSLRRVYCGC